jgi:hypothetical protein
MKFLTLQQFTEMWKLQDSLNTETSGPDWRAKKQNWNLAIHSEVMEFFDYIGWKWWKEPEKTKKPSDMQARLELVDIWHFLLSDIIEKTGEVFENYGNPYNLIVRAVEQLPKATKPSHARFLELSQPGRCLDYKVMDLSDAIMFCDWSWDELYKAYIGKVALNNFRQANGYKEGTYQKIWSVHPMGLDHYEDNYYLESIMDFLTQKDSLSYGKVYSLLEMEYANVQKQP